MFELQLSRHITEHMAAGLTEPLDVLGALLARPDYARETGLTLDDIARRMRALTGDTTALARQIVRARSAATMLEVLDEGEPKDKIQVLAKWGPAVNDDSEGRSGLTIIVGGGSHVQVNIGTPQPVAVSSALTKSERESGRNCAGSDNTGYVNHAKSL